VPFERHAQLVVDDRQVAHLPALAEHGQVAPVVVLELHPCELALAQPEPKEQEQRHSILRAGLGGDQLGRVRRRERSARDLAPARAEDRRGRVPGQPSFTDGPGEEVAQDADHLRARPRRSLAPAVVDELAQPLRADWRLEAGGSRSA
jgi:hypothetical protein